MTIYKLFDIRSLSYMCNVDGTEYYTTDYEKANDVRWYFLNRIVPPNMLMEVIKVHVFTNDVFDGEVLDIHLN